MTIELSSFAILKHELDLSGQQPDSSYDAGSGYNVGDIIIDTSQDPNVVWNCLKNTSGAAQWGVDGSEYTPPAQNPWGDGSDGDAAFYSNTSLSNTQDGDVVVKQYSSLLVDSGVTLTTQNRCRGLAIYVDGDCTINGTLTMTARGCKARPSDATTSTYTPVAPSDGNGVEVNGLRFARLKDGGSDIINASHVSGCGNDLVSVESSSPTLDGNGVVYQIKREGADGSEHETNGSSGLTGESGGGGAGYATTYGLGSDGTCFSGGSGGAGGYKEGTITNATPYGGQGGQGWTDKTVNVVGGTGNPGGLGRDKNRNFDPTYNGTDGTGGLLLLFVKGDLIIASGGKITCDGVDALDAPGNTHTSGASGGGNILILYGGNLTNNGSITANGGEGGTCIPYPYVKGYDGGNGSIQIAQITQ